MKSYPWMFPLLGTMPTFTPNTHEVNGYQRGRMPTISIHRPLMRYA